MSAYVTLSLLLFAAFVTGFMAGDLNGFTDALGLVGSATCG